MNATPRAEADGYVGRFAPSPTGRLHLGSLVAAMASYAQARAAGGRWLVRMEDLDPPRERPGAALAIEADLKRFGMEADEPVLYQSTRAEAYQTALDALDTQGRLFPCACTRKSLRGHAIYPGTCRNGLKPGETGRTLRVRVAGQIGFVDQLQGEQQQDLEREIGDFVVRRGDGLTAYQLAVVVDDAWQGVTEVVRGSDLLDSTPRQIYLQRLLDLPTPRYVHVPVAVNPAGTKLSKQTGATPVDPQNPLPALKSAWGLLGQAALPGTLRATPDEFWEAAIPAWRLNRVPAVGEVAADRYHSGFSRN
ncbi:MAG: tRNA glutamyl-Q(34) synthetase GluQRS [Pseudomonadota bacterium]